MSRTVELVKAWVEYESEHPNGSLEDFCRNYLELNSSVQSLSAKPFTSSSLQRIYPLTRLVNRLSKLWMYFTLNAMKPMGLTSFDEFAFLYITNRSNSIRKKDLIYMQFIEISSGLLVIDRLIKKGFLQERIDEHDKRSKQVSLTKKGKVTLEKCEAALAKVAENLYGEMPAEGIELCMQYLTPVEKNIAQQWNRLKKFEPVFK